MGQQVKCYLKIFCFHPETRNILASENLLAPPVLRNDSMVEVCRENHWDSARVHPRVRHDDVSDRTGSVHVFTPS